MATTTAGRSAGGSVSDFNKMGKESMEAELSVNTPDSGVSDALSGIGRVLNAKGAEMNADLKKIYKEKQKAVDEFGKNLESTFIEIGPEMENLGQESYQKAQDDVFNLREEFVDCSGDSRCEADVMVKLNTAKTRHASDAENAKNLAGLLQGELDEDGIRGESSADIKAMSNDEKNTIEQFGTNKTKRIVYKDNDEGISVLHYEWDVPLLDPITGEQMIGPDGQPIVETKIHSNEDLQEMIPIKETVNGEKLQDFIQAEKEKHGNGQKVSDNAALKEAIGDMIPKTKQALKSWAHSNPAKQNYLNVHDYLVDHPILDGQYEKLGLEDTNGDGLINHKDFLALEDKEGIITRIMDAEDVNLSHDILTDIYASCAGNEINGTNDIEHYPERHVLQNKNEEDIDAVHAKRKEFFDLMSTDKSSFESMTEKEIITKAELTPDEVANGFLYNGEMTTLKDLIPNATKAKGKSGKSVSDYVD